MPKSLRVVLAVIAVAFGLVAVCWLLDPKLAARSFRMGLLEGSGLTTQIGDLWSFFSTLSVFILGGVLTRNSQWFFPPLALLSLAILGRTVAWLFHGADFTADMIAVEATTIVLMLVCFRATTSHKNFPVESKKSSHAVTPVINLSLDQ